MAMVNYQKVIGIGPCQRYVIQQIGRYTFSRLSGIVHVGYKHLLRADVEHVLRQIHEDWPTQVGIKWGDHQHAERYSPVQKVNFKKCWIFPGLTT